MANGRGGRRGRSRTTAFFPKALITMGVESSATAGLDALEAGIREKVLRPMAYAGIKVFYDEIRQRVPVAGGTLFGSIYHYHVERESGPDKQVYATGPNKKKAPHWYNVEYGHWLVNKVIKVNGKFVATKDRLPTPVWVPGVPYVRPAYDAKRATAFAAMRKRGTEKLAEVMREIAA